MYLMLTNLELLTGVQFWFIKLWPKATAIYINWISTIYSNAKCYLISPRQFTYTHNQTKSSVLFKIFMPLDSIDLCECFMCRGVYISIEMPEVKVECLPQLFSTLFYETRSLADPEADQFG